MPYINVDSLFMAIFVKPRAAESACGSLLPNPLFLCQSLLLFMSSLVSIASLIHHASLALNFAKHPLINFMHRIVSPLFFITSAIKMFRRDKRSSADIAELVNRGLSLCVLVLAVSMVKPALAADNVNASLSIQQLKQAEFLDNKALDQLSFTDLARLDNADWQAIPGNLVFLNSDSHFSYLKVTLSNTSPHISEYFLELASNTLDGASAYLFDTNSQTIRPYFQQAGNAYRFNDRPINYRHIVYPMPIDEGQSLTLLIKLEHRFDSKLALNSWSETGFVNKLNRELIFFGMIYGTLLMIIIYNLFIYLRLREKNHLLFFMFGGLSGLFISLHEGHFAQFIAADADWSKSLLLGFICAFMSFSFTFFANYFLDLEKHSLFLYRGLLIAGSACAAFFILLGFSEQNLIFSNLSLIIILALYSAAIWAGIRIWHRGITSAGFFSLAMFLSSFGLFLEYASQLQFTNYLPATFSFSTLGYTAMLFVFAFALADKMRLLQQDKLDASLKLIKLTEEKAQNSLEIYKSRLSEVELEKEKQAAKLQLQAKSEFLSLVSHEIRTPMNSLMGMSELLRDTELSEKQSSYVDSISHSSNALLNVINDILDFSQFESGKMELESRLFNLEKTIDECVNIFSLLNTQQDINFIAAVSPDTPIQLKGDAEKIKQICLSLLNQTLNQTVETIHLSIKPTGKHSVNSTEIGFTIDVFGPHVEHAFFTEWLSDLNQQSDILLALSVSKQLIELMNGELTIEQCDIANPEVGDSEDKDQDTHFTRIMFTTRLLLPHSNEGLQTIDRKALLKDRKLLICHSDKMLSDTLLQLSNAWGMRSISTNDPATLSEILSAEAKPFHLAFIEHGLYSKELQAVFRQADKQHDHSTAITLVASKNFSMAKQEMADQGIRNIFNLPFTTGLFYQSILTNLGIESQQTIIQTEQLRVLIAEDNAVNLMVLEGILKKQGVSAVSCVNGQQAIDAYKHTTPDIDLIFMDCEMPELDGFQACMAIRQFESQFEDRLPCTVIGLSAHTSADAKMKAKSSGMDDFLSKPIKPEDIEQIIFQQLQQQPPAQDEIA